MNDIKEATADSGKVININNYITIKEASDGEAIADTLTRRLELNLRSI